MRSPRAVLALLLVAWPAEAALAEGATPSPGADLRGYRAPMDPRAGMTLEPATTGDTGSFSGGMRLNYAFRPVVLRDANGNRQFSVIEHQLTADVVAAVGFFRRFAIGIDIPAVVAQVGDDLRNNPVAAAAVGTSSLPLTALGDPGIDVKVTLVQPPADDKGASIGIMNRVTIPIGDPNSFLGEGVATDEVRALFDGHFLAAFTVHANAGVKLRGHEADYGCATTATADCKSRFQHELLWGAGLDLDTKLFKVPNMTWFAEVRGYLPIAPIHPFESRLPSGTFASVAARYAVRDVTFFAGPEFALDRGIGNAPVRVTIGVSFTPKSHDRDGDGIEDDVDRCPDQAGPDDADGCPRVKGADRACSKGATGH